MDIKYNYCSLHEDLLADVYHQNMILLIKYKGCLWLWDIIFMDCASRISMQDSTVLGNSINLYQLFINQVKQLVWMYHFYTLKNLWFWPEVVCTISPFNLKKKLERMYWFNFSNVKLCMCTSKYTYSCKP